MHYSSFLATCMIKHSLTIFGIPNKTYPALLHFWLLFFPPIKEVFNKNVNVGRGFLSFLVSICNFLFFPFFSFRYKELGYHFLSLHVLVSSYLFLYLFIVPWSWLLYTTTQLDPIFILLPIFKEAKWRYLCDLQYTSYMH